MDEIKMSNPPEYYQFDLVGVIVHAGTADSGHYYSYIKE
jgi:ubiquitin C-terminal hydrolase